MAHFRVSDMTCSGCVKAITGAVQDLDAAATVDANLDTKQVVIASTVPPRRRIRRAGVTPVRFPPGRAAPDVGGSIPRGDPGPSSARRRSSDQTATG